MMQKSKFDNVRTGGSKITIAFNILIALIVKYRVTTVYNPRKTKKFSEKCLTRCFDYSFIVNYIFLPAFVLLTI